MSHGSLEERMGLEREFRGRGRSRADILNSSLKIRADHASNIGSKSINKMAASEQEAASAVIMP